MKNLFYVFSVIFLFSNLGLAKSQSSGVPTGYGLTYVYTPEGNAVRAYLRTAADMTESEKAERANYVRENYDNVTIVSPATYTYNCHSYAWNMIEGGRTCWIDYSLSFLNYMADGSYVETTEPYAEKIYYVNGDHSAVKSSVSGMVESKWGSGPVVRHPKIVAEYNCSAFRYYAKPPTYTSYPMIGGTERKTFKVSCIPKDMTLTWSYPSSLLREVTVGGNKIILSPKTSTTVGDAYVRANLYNADGSLYKSFFRYVGVGGPHYENVHLEVRRASDGMLVFPNGIGLEPNSYYYANLSCDVATLTDVNWGTSPQLNVGYSTDSELYFSTGSSGWGTLNISAKTSPYSTRKSILGVTLYGAIE